MKKFLTICLINEIYSLNEVDEIILANNISIHKAMNVELDILKSHIELFQTSYYNFWVNYFENEIIPTNDIFNPQTEILKEKNWRYTILMHEKQQLTPQELIALKLSDLNINILIQKGWELETDSSSSEIVHDGDIVVVRDWFSSFNLLIDTTNKFTLYGSKKYLRKKPTKKIVLDFNNTLRQVEEIFNQENQNEVIKKALIDYSELNTISDQSPFKLVSYFSILESLITHNPKSEYGNSISKQLSNKIEFLYNNFFIEFDLKNYFKGPDTDTINTIIYKLYNYRSDVAHGNVPKFHKDLKIIAQNLENVLPFMENLLRQVLRISISKPLLIIGLKKC